MSLSVIPLTILGQITGVTGSGETALYQVSFKSIDGTPLYGVTAVWTNEQAEIEALAAQKPYGVWINPIAGTFTVKFAGYAYVGSADLTDSDVLAGITPIEFANQSGGSSLPVVTAEDNGKMLQVVDGEWEVKQYPFYAGKMTVYDETVTLQAAATQNTTITETYFDLTNFSTWTVMEGDVVGEWSNPDRAFELPNCEIYVEKVGGVGTVVISALDNGLDAEIKIIQKATLIDENFVLAVKQALNIPATDGDGYSMNIVNGAISWSSSK